ncbi:uncharacterized protein [Oscarella lobularis]|uniref:uncharacterized protein isoform X2 n=1 Tax=Oscarella lobularis TaxID=121494 RepID=UPI0033130B0D
MFGFQPAAAHFNVGNVVSGTIAAFQNLLSSRLGRWSFQRPSPIDPKLTPAALACMRELGFFDLPSDWYRNFAAMPIPSSKRQSSGYGFSGSTLFSVLRPGASTGQIRRLQMYSRKLLEDLERLANENPKNSQIQAEYLKTVVDEDPSYVIRRYESGKYAKDAESQFIYIKAKKLVEQEAAEPKKDEFQTFWSPLSSSSSFRAETRRKQPDFESGGDAGSSFTGMGSESQPLHVIKQPNKGSFYKEQLWTTLRFLIGLLLILSLIEGQLQMRMTNNQKPVLPDTSEKKVKFEDVQGVDEAKDELKEIVEFLRSPEKFSRLGGKLPKGVLLIGPPGTGKTMLARAVAGEAGVPFFFCSGSEFDEMFVGVGAARVRNLFNSAKDNSPCIVFIDELDAIGGSRIASDHQPYSRMTLNQLLVELDGFEENSGVVVIGATNFPEVLDKALVRPGRFDSKISIAMPDIRARHKILKVHTKEVPLGKDVDLEVVARGTIGFSGADIANLINQAAIHSSSQGSQSVTMESLEWAKDKIIMGPERKSAVIAEENRRLVAYHEAGHALVAVLTPGAMPVHKATIMPRGQALGMVSQLPEKDELSWSKKQLLARIDVTMGGRAAEELVFGPENITSGASSDFEQATNIAENMVLRFGMSDKVGPVVHRDASKASPEIQNAVDSEVKRLIEESYARATRILKEHSHKHKRLAEALLKYETLTAEEIRLVLDGKSLKRKL